MTDDFYGPLVLGGGRALRPGDEGFEEAEASAVRYDPPPLNLENAESSAAPGRWSTTIRFPPVARSKFQRRDSV